jgi:hypothetical protein
MLLIIIGIILLDSAPHLWWIGLILILVGLFGD